jgi:hypothetical protein
VRRNEDEPGDEVGKIINTYERTARIVLAILSPSIAALIIPPA